MVVGCQSEKRNEIFVQRMRKGCEGEAFARGKDSESWCPVGGKRSSLLWLMDDTTVDGRKSETLPRSVNVTKRDIG